MCIKKNGDGKWRMDAPITIQTIILVVSFVTTTLAVHFSMINKFELAIQELRQKNGTQDMQIEECKDLGKTLDDRFDELENKVTFHLGEDNGR